MSKKAGFTLVEIIVYLAIASIFLVAVISFSWNIASVRNKSKTIEEVHQNARFALERLAQAVRSASSINSDSTLSSNLADSGFLHLDYGSEPDDSDDLYFQINPEKQLTLKTGPTGIETELTSSLLTVNNLTFTPIADTGDHQSLRVDFQLQFTNPNDWQEYDWDITLVDTLTVRVK